MIFIHDNKFNCILFRDLRHIFIPSNCLIQPPVDTKVILGHVASMQCRVSADPNVPFEVDWFHEGRLINAAASHRINIGELYNQ